MTTIAHCSNEAEMMLLRSLLESNGIEVFSPEDCAPMAGMNFAGSGLRLQVNEADAETARKILADAEAAANADEEDGTDESK